MDKRRKKLSKAQIDELDKLLEDDSDSDFEEELEEKPKKKEDAAFEPAEKMQEEDYMDEPSSEDEDTRKTAAKGRGRATPTSRKSTPKTSTPKKPSAKVTPNKEKKEPVTPAKRGRKRKAEDDPEEEKVHKARNLLTFQEPKAFRGGRGGRGGRGRGVVTAGRGGRGGRGVRARKFGLENPDIPLLETDPMWSDPSEELQNPEDSWVASKEFIRAVFTGNLELFKKLLEDKKHVFTLV